MSTSGRSSNVVKGLTAARSLGARRLRSLAPRRVHSPKSRRGPRHPRRPRAGSELHLSAWHAVCDAIEQELALDSAKQEARPVP